VAAPFKTKSRLEAENAALRHQLIVSFPKIPSAADSRREAEQAVMIFWLK
jgi:hypothetical protein